MGRDIPSGFIGLSWAGNARLLHDAAMAGGAGIWSTDVAGGTSDLVVPGGLLPSTSADGRTLVFFRSGELWRADADGRNAARVAAGYIHQIAPDGSRVFYLSAQSGTQTVWVVDLAGGQPRQFTTMTVPVVSDPGVSPDGRQVMFLSGGSAIVMPIDGGEPIPRIGMPTTRLRWTPDGRGLTYADAAGTNLWVQPIDGGATRQLTTFADFSTGILAGVGHCRQNEAGEAVMHEDSERTAAEDERVAPDPVIDAYKKDVDRTLIREQLRRSVDARVRNMLSALRFAEASRARSNPFPPIFAVRRRACPSDSTSRRSNAV